MIETRLELGRNTGENEMAKANKDGWIRHRGGKQPVADETLIDVLFRSRERHPRVMTADSFYWSHHNEPYDIMSYRIHPAEQQAPQPMTAEQIRTKYIENLASIAMLHTKNAALVDDLRKMGFDFYDSPKEPQEDMSDPRNWMVGDMITVTNIVDTRTCKIESIDFDEDEIQFIDDAGDKYRSFLNNESFKFHSRPTK